MGLLAKYVGLAQAAGLDWQTVRDWDEQHLASRLQPANATPSAFVEPHWGLVAAMGTSEVPQRRKGLSIISSPTNRRKGQLKQAAVGHLRHLQKIAR